MHHDRVAPDADRSCNRVPSLSTVMLARSRMYSKYFAELMVFVALPFRYRVLDQLALRQCGAPLEAGILGPMPPLDTLIPFARSYYDCVTSRVSFESHGHQ